MKIIPSLRRLLPVILLGLSLGAAEASAQAVTTSVLAGRVVDDAGAAVSNAQVEVVNTATGTRRATLTNDAGRFLLPGLRPGGPYTVRVVSIGFADEEVSGLQLALGRTETVNLVLRTEAVQLQGIEVTGVSAAVRNGVGTVVADQQIQRSPTLNREIVDVARLTPQAFVANEDDDGAAISIAGQNNEYNALYIDGVVNNDVFGLSAQGTNGGQTGAPPISFDAIEQLQIAISPFDVTQSGFTGGAINAITRSGTNEFKGSFYYQGRGDALSGESVWLPEPQPLPDFSANRYGFRLGGPVVRDKVFFFVNGEIFRSETPRPFVDGLYEGDTDIGGLEDLRQFLVDEAGYDPGDFREKASALDDNKVLGKLDWNINDDHRLTLRHSWSQSDNIDAFESSRGTINFDNTAEVFPNETHSSALELNSTFGDRFQNKLLMGLTFVRDDRGFAGDPFPYVRIDDGGSNDIQLGSERFSTGNILNQDIFSITNNFTWFAGDHTLTFGTHNEFYSIANLFIRENFGFYEYASLEDFRQSVLAASNPAIDPVEPVDFTRSFSLVDDVTGDASDAIGAFDAYQLGFYVQDEWRVTDRLRLTGGLRVDIPEITTQPRTSPVVRDEIFPQLAQYYDLEGAQPGTTPDAALYWSPRLGFTWDVTADRTQVLRGGAGIFTGRVPFVYPGAMFLNNGVTVGGAGGTTLANGEPVPFVPDPQNGLTAEDFGFSVNPSGEVDVFEAGFRYPRVFRASLGFDTRLPWGLTGTLEGQFTRNLDNILVENINLLPQNDQLDGPDNRPVYNYGINERFGSFDVNAARIQREVDPVLKVSNYDDGYTYDVTASLGRNIGESTFARVSYTYGDARSVNDATSDQIFSVWRFNENVNGLNNLDEARSDFSLGHRFLANVSHRQEFLRNLATSISVVFEGVSGRPFSYIIGNSFGFTGEGSGTSPLAYIPENASDLLFEEYTFDDRTVTVPEQEEALDALIANTSYLRSRRGDYAERNAMRFPTEWIVDLRISQEVFGNVAGRRNTIELTLDIFNFTNLLNDDWGRRYNAGFRTINLVDFQEFRDPVNGDLTPIYQYRLRGADGELLTDMDDYFEDEILDFGTYGSRWLMQFGVRYTF